MRCLRLEHRRQSLCKAVRNAPFGQQTGRRPQLLVAGHLRVAGREVVERYQSGRLRRPLLTTLTLAPFSGLPSGERRRSCGSVLGPSRRRRKLRRRAVFGVPFAYTVRALAADEKRRWSRRRESRWRLTPYRAVDRQPAYRAVPSPLTERRRPTARPRVAEAWQTVRAHRPPGRTERSLPAP